MAQAPKLQPGSVVEWRSLEWLVLEPPARDGEHDDALHLRPCDPSQSKLIGSIRVARALVAPETMKVLPQHDELVFPQEMTARAWSAHPLRLAALPYLRFPAWSKSDRLLWSKGVRLEELDRQLVPLATALEQSPVRLLIADDVGLGKTSEAALIISELLARRRAARILVVCPAHLVQRKWLLELNGRFGLSFTGVTGDTLPNVYDARHLAAHDNPFISLDRVVVSLDWAKQSFIRSRLAEAGFDLVVIDEAHRVAKRGTDGTASLTYRLARDLSKRCGGLVLMTATPHDGTPDAFASLIDLLETAGGQGGAKPVVIRRLRRDLAPGHKDKAPDPKFERFHLHPAWKDTSDLLEELLQRLGREDDCPVQLLRVTLLKRFLSSPKALFDTLRLDWTLEEGAGGDGDEDMTSLGAFLETERGKDLRVALEAQREALEEHDAKVEALIALLRSQPADENVVIFTEYVSTARYLEGRMTAAFASSGGRGRRKVLVATGSDEKERDAAVETFTTKDRCILIATDALSEGVDLQYRCHRLVHYDLPFRPYRLEQRQGRVDRMGQTADKVDVRLLAPFDDELERWARARKGGAQYILATTLSINRLYGFLNAQARALGGSIVPVLERMPELHAGELQIAAALPTLVTKLEGLAIDPDAPDLDRVPPGLEPGKRYELCVAPRPEKLGWTGQGELGMSSDLLAAVVPHVVGILAECWNHSRPASLDVEKDDDALTLTGMAVRSMRRRLDPCSPQSRGDKGKAVPLRLVIKPERPDRDHEVVSWASAFWEELAEAIYWKRTQTGGANVALSQTAGGRTGALVLTIRGPSLAVRLFVQEGARRWIAVSEAEALEALRDELRVLGTTRARTSEPGSSHQGWAKQVFSTAREDFQEGERLLGMILRVAKGEG